MQQVIHPSYEYKYFQNSSLNASIILLDKNILSFCKCYRQCCGKRKCLHASFTKLHPLPEKNNMFSVKILLRKKLYNQRLSRTEMNLRPLPLA